jgi:Zn-dependent oligopeptidase
MTDLSANPLLNPPKLPNGAPALDRVKAEHVLPAIKAAIAENKAEIEAIKNNPAAPTFANTIEALEFSGTTLGRVSLVFANISLANSDDALRAIRLFASKIAEAVSGGRGMRESAQADDGSDGDGDGRRQARPARQARPEQATTPASV